MLKMVIGRINKYFKDICLLNQAFIKDSDLDVETFVKNAVGKVLSFIRYEVAFRKRDENFAKA